MTHLVPAKSMTTAVGGIVMAIGIFTLYTAPIVIQQSNTILRIFACGVVIAWLGVAVYIGRAIVARRRVYSSPRRFAIGTLVAGTAVTALVCHRYFPSALWLGDALLGIMLIIYIPYVWIIVREYISLWRHPLRQQSTGVILLATVATQSVIIALHEVAGAVLPLWLEYVLIGFDILFLLSGQLFILLHYARRPVRDIADTWHTTNCIVHGSVSITGLAVTVLSAVAPTGLVFLWCVAAALFVYIEGIECLRLMQRWRRYGWRRGVWVYDVSQWSRNFTFGMFIAFTWTLLSKGDVGGGIARSIADVVVACGPIVVSALLVIELILMIRQYAGNHRQTLTD